MNFKIISMQNETTPAYRETQVIDLSMDLNAVPLNGCMIYEIWKKTFKSLVFHSIHVHNNANNTMVTRLHVSRSDKSCFSLICTVESMH